MLELLCYVILSSLLSSKLLLPISTYSSLLLSAACCTFIVSESSLGSWGLDSWGCYLWTGELKIEYWDDMETELKFELPLFITEVEEPKFNKISFWRDYARFSVEIYWYSRIVVGECKKFLPLLLSLSMFMLKCC